jgi:uncharacterized protein YjlB
MPCASQLTSRTDMTRVNKQEPLTFRFADDGLVPNHARWPMLVYPGAVTLRADAEPASVLEDLFGLNGWGDSWRNGIFGYVHYHSRIHEVLGIARGTAEIRFGGDKGKILDVKAGDIVILPAGTATNICLHRTIFSSSALTHLLAPTICAGAPNSMKRRYAPSRRSAARTETRSTAAVVRC